MSPGAASDIVISLQPVSSTTFVRETDVSESNRRCEKFRSCRHCNCLTKWQFLSQDSAFTPCGSMSVWDYWHHPNLIPSNLPLELIILLKILLKWILSRFSSFPFISSHFSALAWAFASWLATNEGSAFVQHPGSIISAGGKSSSRPPHKQWKHTDAGNGPSGPPADDAWL